MTETLSYAIYDSPYGQIILGYDAQILFSLQIATPDSPRPITLPPTQQKTPFTDTVFQQLQEYFGGARQTFDIPFQLLGTPFQQKVWRALTTIPYGNTWTYAQLAAAAGNPQAARAVGNANNKNPLPIIIPCHRVIGASGHLTGYAYGLALKEKLLRLEKQFI